MKTVFVLLAIFLVIGLFTQKFNTGIRLLLLAIIVMMIVYITYL